MRWRADGCPRPWLEADVETTTVAVNLGTMAMSAAMIALLSTPVWLAARVVGADYPTLARSVASLLLGVAATLVCALFAGGFAWLLGPLAFLVSFKLVLGTSTLSAMMLAIIAVGGYFALGQVLSLT